MRDQKKHFDSIHRDHLNLLEAYEELRSDGTKLKKSKRSQDNAVVANEHYERITRLENDSVAKALDSRFSDIGKRVDGVDGRIDSFTRGVSPLVERVGKIECLVDRVAKVESLVDRVAKLENIPQSPLILEAHRGRNDQYESLRKRV